MPTGVLLFEAPSCSAAERAIAFCRLFDSWPIAWMPFDPWQSQVLPPP
jgi:hypothetical protein